VLQRHGGGGFRMAVVFRCSAVCISRFPINAGLRLEVLGDYMSVDVLVGATGSRFCCILLHGVISDWAELSLETCCAACVDTSIRSA
jgi:hypothetical protein